MTIKDFVSKVILRDQKAAPNPKLRAKFKEITEKGPSLEQGSYQALLRWQAQERAFSKKLQAIADQRVQELEKSSYAFLKAKYLGYQTEEYQEGGKTYQIEIEGELVDVLESLKIEVLVTRRGRSERNDLILTSKGKLAQERGLRKKLWVIVTQIVQELERYSSRALYAALKAKYLHKYQGEDYQEGGKTYYIDIEAMYDDPFEKTSKNLRVVVCVYCESMMRLPCYSPTCSDLIITPEGKLILEKKEEIKYFSEISLRPKLKAKLKEIAEKRLQELKKCLYQELKEKYLDNPQTEEYQEGDKKYYIEIEAMYDGIDSQDLRIRVAVDDTEFSAFSPTCSDLIITPEGKLL